MRFGLIKVGLVIFILRKPLNGILQLYSDRLATVEVNSTFYVIPDRQTVERWAKDTPANFKFCPKFPKQLTHNGLLLPYLDQALHF